MDRDIVLPGADLHRWALVMQWVEEIERTGTAEVERRPNPLPELADFLPPTELTNPPASEWPRQPSLAVVLDGIRLKCWFYEQSSIEFQVDPYQLDSPDKAELLLGFVRELAKAADLTAYITEENMHDLRWLAFEPTSDEWQWTPLPD
jgi:hypothetical protein